MASALAGAGVCVRCDVYMHKTNTYTKHTSIPTVHPHPRTLCLLLHVLCMCAGMLLCLTPAGMLQTLLTSYRARHQARLQGLCQRRYRAWVVLYLWQTDTCQLSTRWVGGLGGWVVG